MGVVVGGVGEEELLGTSGRLPSNGERSVHGRLLARGVVGADAEGDLFDTPVETGMKGGTALFSRDVDGERHLSRATT